MKNYKIVFNICLNHGGRQEIVSGANLIIDYIGSGKLKKKTSILMLIKIIFILKIFLKLI